MLLAPGVTDQLPAAYSILDRTASEVATIAPGRAGSGSENSKATHIPVQIANVQGKMGADLGD